ncbi:MAG: hypothetical protein BAJALOKI3v1_40044 [Promethearchaeota archaeon]|nr:MAG: hypothetical protein BAJALOKI3v1_40044 [Candidatus Lokiarchaeota archaeon]
MSRTRKEELEILRKKITDAIRFSEKYWLIFRQGTFGLATVLDLEYKKSFIEVLFFTNTDVLEKGVPLLKINTPIETTVDFNEILVEPDFDEDGLISPRKIIQRIDKLIEREFQHHLKEVDRELELLNDNFENYQLDQIPYHRRVRIYFPGFYVQLDINFENYPLQPNINFSRFLSRIIKLEEFSQLDIIRNWDELNPPHIIDLIEELIDIILSILEIRNFYKNYQHLLLEDVSISDELEDISFRLTRGQSLGILYEGSSESSREQINIMRFFSTIAGKSHQFSGTIKIFGKFIQLTTEEDLEKIFIVPEAIDSKMAGMKLKKAIKYNVETKIKGQRSKEEFMNILRESELTTLFDEWMTKGPFWKSVSFLQDYRERRQLRKRALQITGVYNKRKNTVSDLKALDYFLFCIARALIQSPDIIMFSLPKGILNRLQYEKFKKYLEDVKREFHVALIVHGPETIISDCDKVLTITEKGLECGTKEELIEKIPQSGELITVELNYPNTEAINKLFELKSAIVIEERKYEKYKLFPKEAPNEIIKKLIHIFGPDLYSFKRYRASLTEVAQFLELTY